MKEIKKWKGKKRGRQKRRGNGIREMKHRGGERESGTEGG